MLEYPRLASADLIGIWRSATSQSVLLPTAEIPSQPWRPGDSLDLFRQCLAAITPASRELRQRATLYRALRAWTDDPDRKRGETLRSNPSKGGKARAANRAAADPNAWMRPIFAAAWARLDADCPKRIGHERLLVMARRIAGPGHPDHYRRDEMKERQARAYLKSIAESSQ